MPVKHRIHEGFTVVELIVVIVLFALLVPVVFLSLESLRAINNDTRDVTNINGAVENQIELLRAKPFDQLTAGTVEFTNNLPDTIRSPRSANYTIATMTNSNLKQVDINISYFTGKTTRNLAYRTIISNKDTP